MSNNTLKAVNDLQRNEVKNFLIAKCVDVCDCEIHDTASDAAKSLQDHGMDSLDVIEVVMLAEKEYNINIPDELLDGNTSISSLTDYIMSH
jgi:acyl carrier protein